MGVSGETLHKRIVGHLRVPQIRAKRIGYRLENSHKTEPTKDSLAEAIVKRNTAPRVVGVAQWKVRWQKRVS